MSKKKDEGPELLILKEACEYLHLTESALYRNMRKNKLPCFKIGPKGPWRFDKAKLKKWMQENAEKALKKNRHKC